MHRHILFTFATLPTLFLIVNFSSIFFFFKEEEDPTSSNPKVKYVPCWSRDFGHGSIVCQCNVTYCDTMPPLSIKDLKRGDYYLVKSDKNGSRFVASTGKVSSTVSNTSNLLDADVVKITINRDMKFQEIQGFGGAFTDATGINIVSLPDELQDIVIRQYFDDKVGLNYTFARVPMGGTDFSTWTYSYDDDVDQEDINLRNFRLRTEDEFYKIPFIQRAVQFQPHLKLLASPWSAPKWMKTNGAFSGKGSLKHQYYQVWANYFIKFLESYADHNITFWGVTTQNEPTAGNLIDYPFNCMGWTAKEQREWIRWNLGPTLQNSTFSKLKIIMLDDDRINLANWPEIILSDKEAAKYVSGIGVHWYVDALVSASLLERTHHHFPEKWLLATEASTGFLALEKAVILGSWERAELYAEDIISDLNHWVTGWIDWNMVLNMSGGPNWAGNELDAPIIVDRDHQIIYKQPMFYVLGHFSKFIPSGAIRISTISDNFRGLSVLACLRPDGWVTVIILNVLTTEISLQLNETYGGYISLSIMPDSIYTLVYERT